MSNSRIGRKPIEIPAGIEVKLQEQTLTVKGPKGLLSFEVHPFVLIDVDGGQIRVQPNKSSGLVITGSKLKLYRSIVGSTRANISNVVQGVSQGFEKRLTLVGIGYRAQAKDKVLSLTLGFSHPCEYKFPDDITIETPTQTEIIIKGVDKIKVGEIAAQIRDIRPPEPYKGKGVRYSSEKIELKETKKK